MDHRPPRPDQPYAWDDERLSAYLDGELSAPEQAQLEARLVVDPELRQLVDELRAVRQQLEILPEYRLQATFAQQVLRRAEQEMLLSPLGHVTADTPLHATTAANPGTAVEPSASPLPRRSTARLWRRGAIWTAVAAAAVLLLIVTNRPRGPELDPVARHDLPEGVTVETGAAKPGAANAPVPAAKSSAADSAAMPALNGYAAEGFGTTQGDEGKSLRKQTVPAEIVPSDVAPVNNSPPAPPVVSMTPNNSMTKSADAVATGPDPNQIARTPGAKGMNSDAVPGKALLKNQASGQSLAMQDKQADQLRKQLPTELAALLASEEFSQLAAPRDEKRNNSPSTEQVLVVYLTPRPEGTGDRSFESLLASNSIELAEKSLAQPGPADRQRTLAKPAPKLESTGAEPLAKAASEKKQAAETKDRKSAEIREAGKTEDAGNDSAIMKEKIAPASESSDENHEAAGNELYYLEADVGQVNELLRQLRASPQRFSRLSVAARELPQPANRSNFRYEKTLESPKSPSVTKAESERVDAALASSEPRGKQELGDQQHGALQQYALGSPPAPPASADPAGTPVPPPTPAAESATMPSAARAPAVTPATTALPSTPRPEAVASAPSIMPGDAPAAKAEASSNVDLPNAAQSIERQPNKSQPSERLGNAERGSRRGVQTDKSLHQVAGERVIAYRLRGIESLKFANKAEAIDSIQGAGGGFGGGAKSGKADFDITKASEAEKSRSNGKPADALKPSAAAEEQKADGVIPGQAASSSTSNTPLPAAPQAGPMVVAPQKMGVSESKSDLQANAVRSSDPDRIPVSGEATQRLLMRNKEMGPAEEKVPAEVAKKSAPVASERVRVLFVIEREHSKK